MLSPPSHDCTLCPRLAAFRAENRVEYPSFFNAPVPSFGGLDARLLVVGLAPGLKGANQTGRPFTGDYAGIVLYPALQKHGFAEGEYNPSLFLPSPEGGSVGEGDGFKLKGCRITNAVRCVPPANKPENDEIRTCNAFLKKELAALPKLRVILSLGQISHNAVLRAFGLKLSAAKFSHGAEHALPRGITLLSSYHTSRYNINTGALTVEMFDKIVERAGELAK